MSMNFTFMKRILLVILFLLYLAASAKMICFAQTSASQLQRMEEVLEEQEVLRKKLEKEEKIYIRRIIVTGVTLLSEDEIKEIVLPFKNRWLSKDDIQQILYLVTAAYKQKGYHNQPKNISYQIKKRCLIIKVEELTH